MHHHEHPQAADDDLADLLDLDGDVLHDYWSQALTWVRQAAGFAGNRRVVDLGAGSGTGTIGLAHRFGEAEVVAVDADHAMLRRVCSKALDLGLAGRVRTLHADLDLGLPDVGAVDVAWASMSLHHLTDPDRVLRDLLAATRPGGLVAVAEFDEPLRFLPHDVGFGRPGLEDRCLQALRAEHVGALPELGADWGARLAATGFVVTDERTFTVDLRPPGPAGTARYARLWLQRLRSGLSERLAPDDLAALDRLLEVGGTGAVERRDDLHVRGCRTVTLARRP